MLLYVTVGSNDIARAGRFYDAALKPLGLVRYHSDDTEIGYGLEGDTSPRRRARLWVTRPYDGKPANFGNGSMLAFDAATRAAVDAFHAAALGAGGSDEGAPGLRPYSPTFYACYVRDPDGNKLSAVCERAQG